MLEADHKLFGQMILIATSRDLKMRDVSQHPLGPLPWSLTNCDGMLKKTGKARLGKELEKKVPPADNTSSPSATIIDGMFLVQGLHGENHTFAELSENMFASVLNAGAGSQRIDVVFDAYRKLSIKSAERTRRGCNFGVMFS